MPSRHRPRRVRPRRGVMSFGRRVRTIVNQNQETKFQAFVGQIPIVATALVVDLCAIAEGTTRAQRVGTKIRLSGIDIQFIVLSVDIAGPFTARIYVFKDKAQTVGGLPPPPSGVFTTADTDRFVIKMDKFFTVAETTSGAARVHMFRFRKRWPANQSGTEVQYDGNLSTTGVKNNWYLSFQSNDGVPTGNLQASFIARTSYKDA